MMTDPNKLQKWDDYLREYEESSLPSPSSDWVEGLVEQTLQAPRKQSAFPGKTGVAIPLLLFFLLNGLLIMRLQAPSAGEQELRLRTLQQVENELLIPSSPVN